MRFHRIATKKIAEKNLLYNSDKSAEFSKNQHFYRNDTPQNSICHMKYVHELTMKVRDYECDLQGVVNNANYQHYLEHARHEFLWEAGISFAELHEQGTDAMVARIAITYKTPLRSGDSFVCKLRMVKEGVRYVFRQDIFRQSDNKLCVRATVDTVCVVHGRLSTSPELEAALADYLSVSDAP